MNPLVIDVDIARPRADVLRWWTGFPDDYRAQDPREQPHRIKVVRRTEKTVELLTWFRMPWLPDVVVRETMIFKDDGNFDIDVRLPLGVRQYDVFTFTEQDGRTHLHVDIRCQGGGPVGTLASRAYWRVYAQPNIPRVFRSAARLCERDAPRVA